jgi:hypothetical protein
MAATFKLPSIKRGRGGVKGIFTHPFIVRLSAHDEVLSPHFREDMFLEGNPVD